MRRLGRRRVLDRSLYLALYALALVSSHGPAKAVDVTCIESSRYQYLYKLFGGDPQRFAAYFKLDPTSLPPPTACRAALVSGMIQPKTEDSTKLLQIIAENQGWLDTLYLDSPGGNIGGGAQLALITRNFWLKTRVVPNVQRLVYEPDFGPPASSGAQDPDRLAYDKAVAAVATPRKSKWAQCASACTYSLAAGVDRNGIAKVHRPSNTNASLEGRAGAADAETVMMNLYQKLDVGDDFMAAARSTAQQTTCDIVISRYPRFIEDALLDQCKSDAAQLDDLAALLRFTIAAANNPLANVRDADLKAALARLETRRRDVGHCVNIVNEKERLAAFALRCPQGCDIGGLREKFDQRMQDLFK